MSKLTSKNVGKKIKEGRRGLTSDGGGLYLKVSTPGNASWIFRYKTDKKCRDMGLGRYPEIGLAAARNLAFQARQLRAIGLDPIEEKAKAEAIAKQARFEAEITNHSFANLTDRYIANHSPAWRSTKHRSQWENTMRAYTFPVIGHLPPNQVQTTHIMEILTPIWEAKTETANRVRNRIELILDFAKALGYTTGTNPARWRGHLDKLLPKRSKIAPVKHHAAIHWSEIQPLVQTLMHKKAPAYQALLMTILTACRTSEVLNARWEEIDWENLTWTIPAHRMKAGKEHRVPIVPYLAEILSGTHYPNDSGYLFPGHRNGKPLSNMAMTMALRRIGKDNITVHGFRSTFRDWAAENTTHPREVCEQALAHTLASHVEAAYRRGDLLDKRSVLMADWSNYLLGEYKKTIVKQLAIA